MSPNDHFILRKIISFFESNLLELLSGTSRSEATDAISNCMEYGSRLANAAELSEPLFSVELREVCESGTSYPGINISKWSEVSSALPDLRRDLFALKKINSSSSYKAEHREPKSKLEIGLPTIRKGIVRIFIGCRIFENLKLSGILYGRAFARSYVNS